MASQTDLLENALSGYKPENMATIIDRLAGDKDNLRVDFQNVKFHLRNQKFTINGFVLFNVIHEVANSHEHAKEEAKKRV